MIGEIMIRKTRMRRFLCLGSLLVFAAYIQGSGVDAQEQPSVQPSAMAPAQMSTGSGPTLTTAPSMESLATAPTEAHGGELTDMSLEDLMNVEVTSVSKNKESIADAPAAVTVISQDDITRSGFSTIPDLLVPGMGVARINSYSWAVSARGLNNQFANDLLVLQDGRSVYTPINAGVYWGSVDYVLQDLEHLEVIRGPTPV
jgi:outer membrane receptor for ferrienterochelin and colicin